MKTLLAGQNIPEIVCKYNNPVDFLFATSKSHEMYIFHMLYVPIMFYCLCFCSKKISDKRVKLLQKNVFYIGRI